MWRCLPRHWPRGASSGERPRSNRAMRARVALHPKRHATPSVGTGGTRAQVGEGIAVHDLVIKGGTVVDGTGLGVRTADVAITDGHIAAVGSDVGPTRRTLDADGLLVTPGWVDVHSHYDGQALWDPVLD